MELSLPPLPALERLRCVGERGHRSRRDDGRERALEIDSTTVRAHVSAAGGKGDSIGRSRGGFTSKIHCLSDARGRPISFDLTPGEAADCKRYDTLIELPERAPGALVADKAYDCDAIRDDLKQRGIRAVPAKIEPRQNDLLQQAALSSAKLHRAGAWPSQDQPRRRHTI
jgi:transposase